MGRTVWYPGHMAKGRRELEAMSKNIDIIIEVRDARAPALSSSPLLNIFTSKIKVWTVLSKADLANDAVTKLWVSYLKNKNLMTFPLDLRKGGVANLRSALSAARPSFRDTRVAVVGTPNVGKSMLINQLVGRKAAPVGGIPGITRGVSWFSGRDFLLADSPGILDPHSDPRAHRLISWIGSSKGEVIGNFEEHAKDCIKFLMRKNLWGIAEASMEIEHNTDTSVILESIGRRYGKLISGGAVDMEASGRMFIEAFATGKFGKMSFEKPKEPPLWELL